MNHAHSRSRLRRFGKWSRPSIRGKYLIEPKTEDDLPEVFLRINVASAEALYRLLNTLRMEGDSEGADTCPRPQE